jgi:Protein of unknown function (DUF2585)
MTSDQASTGPLHRRVAAGLRANRWPVLACVVILAIHPIVLRFEGRRWWCACGQPFLWASDVNGPHCSQHLADPYSFSHVEHGILFYGLFTWLWPRMALGWRFAMALAVEVTWEIVENTNWVIDRYREATVSLDYLGDTVGNSIGDVLSCAIGFYLARRIGLWPSVAVIVAIEVVMLLSIRDNLLLNILMLLHPFEAVKQWQAGA